MLMRFALFLIVAASLVTCAHHASGQESDPPVPQDVAGQSRSTRARMLWSEVRAEEKLVVEQMLESSDWAFRTLAVMRLERYEDAAVRAFITGRLSDESWQVRCFAIRHAWMHAYKIDPALFENEEDTRVIRTLLRHGVSFDDEKLNELTLRLLRANTVDALLMGIELGASTTNDGIRKNASRRMLNLVADMSPSVAAVIGRRLAQTLQINPPPRDVVEWRQWLAQQPRTWELPTPGPPAHALQTVSLIAQADAETFARLRDYMGALRQRDLEMAIAIDATNSMTPVIDQVKADVDALILFLSDISATMRLGLLAYRDHDNPGRLVEAHPFSTNLESLRNFLFGLQTPGGATYPEAVLAGIDACRQFEWNVQAEREVILIGDAPPHDHEASDLRRLLAHFVDNGFTVHAVHVPMEWPRGYVQSLPPARAQQQESWREDYNIATCKAFSEIAALGGGKLVELDTGSQSDLVRSVMRLTIEKNWWPYFDEFYDAYLDLCR